MSQDVAAHTPDIALEPAQGLAHALELLRMRVAPGLGCQPRSEPRIALPQRHLGRTRQRHQLRSRALVEPRVGRMSNGLLHHRGIHRHALQALLLDRPGCLAGLDRLGEQPLDAFFADPVAPAGERGRVDGRAMLEECLAGEVLVVGVLDPPRDHRIVRQPEGMLQIEQPCHQPRRRRRPPLVRGEEPGPFPLEELPVDQRRELHQLMA
jgi:hypothetical protein